MDIDKHNYLNISDIPLEKWNRLAQKKIYFGHQSVGYNIIDGLRGILAENPNLKLNIVESRNVTDFNTPVFAHSTIGRNEDPLSKTNDFVKVIEAGVGGKIDLAFHKYCYIDLNDTSDIGTIFQHYQKKMRDLKSHYPFVKFIHVTMPLTSIQTGPKAWIKKMLGKPVSDRDSNIKRNEFNELLVKEYRGIDPIFDLAKIEALRPDGELAKFNKNGKDYLCLYDAYTDDGGHLNLLGRKIMAEALISFLIEVSQ